MPGILAAGSLVVPQSASAHDGESAFGGFVAGATHPLTGGDHLLAMVAVGIWGAILGRPLIAILPIIFPIMMAAGGLLGLAGVGLPAVETGIALSVFALGAAIASAWRAPALIALAIVGAFAIFHGHAHGTELPEAVDPAAYSVGFLLVTGLLHLVGIALGSLYARPFGPKLVRGVGASIAACGAYFVMQAAV